MRLVYSLPPCYQEYIAVQAISKRKAAEKPRIHHVLAQKFRHYKHQMCGVQNQLHLYPEELDVEIIYANKAVETESEFSVLFQVIDSDLIITEKSNLRIVQKDFSELSTVICFQL